MAIVLTLSFGAVTVTTAPLPLLIPRAPTLTETQAREIYCLGEEAVVCALLSLLSLAQQRTTPPPIVTPTTPPAMIPHSLKPKPDGRRKRLVHLRRELKVVEQYGRPGPSWPA